jgi:glutamate carboxypeptidase
VTPDKQLLALRHRIDDLLPEYLDHLRAIVDIDSGTYDKAGVDAVGMYLTRLYQPLGGKAERFAHDTYGDTLTISFEGEGRGNILLIGHLDTVFPAGTVAERPFHIEDGRAFGPGVADMKSGDLSIVYALRVLLESGFRDFGHIMVIHNPDEEVGSPTSKTRVHQESLRADTVLVLEPGRQNGAIVSARKGIASFDLTVRGIAAHAGVNHDVGRSAALELAHLVIALEAINGTIPETTLNVGRIEAGTRRNVVPEYGTAQIEARSFEMSHLQTVIDRVTALVAESTVEGTGAEVQVSVEHHPMAKTEAGQRLVEVARGLATELGFDLDDVATGGASDGNTAASAGRPVLDGLGPVGGGAHSPGEWMDVASVPERTALLAGLIATLGANPPQG